MGDKKHQDSVPDEVKQAWDIVTHAPMEAHRSFGRPCDRSVHLGGEEKERQLEGIVYAPGSRSARKGPVVAKNKCRDGAVWVIDYDDQSPYHAFAGREVVVSGVSCAGPAQKVIGVTGITPQTDITDPVPLASLFHRTQKGQFLHIGDGFHGKCRHPDKQAYDFKDGD